MATFFFLNYTTQTLDDYMYSCGASLQDLDLPAVYKDVTTSAMIRLKDCTTRPNTNPFVSTVLAFHYRKHCETFVSAGKPVIQIKSNQKQFMAEK